MSLNRYSKRRDANQGEIVDALERAGAEVWVVDRPADLLVWFRHQWFVLESKTSRGRLTSRQSRDRAEGLCEGVVTVRTPMSALRAIGAVSESVAHNLTVVGCSAP